jgi:hypothetical protein
MRRGNWCAKRVNKLAATAGLVVAVSLLAGCGTGAAVPATRTAGPQQLAQVIRQEFLAVTDDQARMVVAIQQDL